MKTHRIKTTTAIVLFSLVLSIGWALPTSITTNGFTANWTVSTGADKYFLDISTSSGFGSYLPGYKNKNVGNVNSNAVTKLSAGTTYYYRVRAANSSGTSGNSNVRPVTTLGGTAAVPTLKISMSSATGAILSWTGSGYKVQQNSNGMHPAKWSDVDGGTNSPVQVKIGGSSKIFRLVPQ